jgi:hypothetical protein
MEKYKNVNKPAKIGYWDQSIFAIIRPPKVQYTLDKLGPLILNIKNNKSFRRK